ncbi:MAG TPA: hypothetical protein VKE70_19880 [Candidatus Solibacter sp.]|nr:hypothetical protein [Candidatus Solibacter sp.]
MFAGVMAQKVSPPLYPKSTFATLLSRTGCNDTSSKSGSQRNIMSHFAIDQWVDFTRGITADEERARMSTHLEGCEECGRLAEFTDKLGRVYSSSAAVEVPEYALRLARAIFPVRASSRPKRGNRIPIELIFDSFLAPAPVGLRATWQTGWQGLYRAGDCSVDLRIEPELQSSRAAVIGQITNHLVPDVDMSNLPVSLRLGNQLVAETVSNRFGEFQMEYEERAQLKLCIHLADSKIIQVPLKKITAEQTGAVAGRKVSRKRAGGRQ